MKEIELEALREQFGLQENYHDTLEGYLTMPSGLIVPDSVAPEIIGRPRPKAIDLFCGCGGASLGFIQAGFEVVAACDFDPRAVLTYMTNLGSYPCRFIFVEDSDRARLEKALTKSYKKAKRQLELPLLAGTGWISSQTPKPPGVGLMFMGDIAKISGAQILEQADLGVGELDMLFGSPPCQGYSRAGKRRVEDPRNELLFEYARLICEIRPKTLAMENVPGITSMVTKEGVDVLDAFCRILEDGNYAGYEAMKRSIKAQAGITLMRGRADKKATRNSGVKR